MSLSRRIIQISQEHTHNAQRGSSASVSLALQTTHQKTDGDTRKWEKKKKKVQSVFPVTARACDRSFLQSDSAPGTSAFRAQMISCEENKEVVEEGRSREPERRHEQEWK